MLVLLPNRLPMSPLFKEMRPLPRFQPTVTEESLQVSLIIPARESAHTLEQAVQEADQFLRTRFNNSYEIILVPNPAPSEGKRESNSRVDLSTQTSQYLATRFPAVRVHPHSLPAGKGAAIQTGYGFARGEMDFFNRRGSSL